MIDPPPYVIDGDTIRHLGTTIRLQGFDAPERRGHCHRERTLAQRASDRLRTLTQAPGATLELTPGTCGYGRACGTIRLHGKDIASIMISEGLASPMLCHHGRCTPKKNWCAGG